MRDGSLASSPVLSLLEESFISTWALVVDLEELKNDSTQLEMSKIAATFLDSYRFPVMMMVASPEGKVVHAVNANEFLDRQQTMYEAVVNLDFGDPSIVNYVGFLKEGIIQWQKARHQTD